MTTTASSRSTSLKWVGAFVDERVRKIQHGYLNDHSDAVATLAKLRRGAGKPLGDVPELWGLTIDDDFYRNAPRGDERALRGAENAAHIALTLYAAHQQSRRDARMHQPGRDLGGAVRRLMPPGDIDEPTRKRFVQVGAATNMGTLAYRLREIVVLLRRDSVPLDYGLLADQLTTAQRPGGMKEVRAAWGRGFHAHRPRTAENPDPGPDTTDKDAS
ncbi:type I-E CRISPR-associated protein Cse2/CasB [Actinorugispora endophytica]|uniref:CRISPR-associated Cse2 family protein n=1 Tax=Actinorugispora endophytica TaxID=1605990 RepID=A0A4R6UZZ9_9ACTN|nr:type I-E CRISPR-associated protein Cse2/CasB [Actinorugispora endophytica]TDQ53220.1 CRISPR-associated Cse2 family protein [Actinorugispora endophytica]